MKEVNKSVLEEGALKFKNPHISSGEVKETAGVQKKVKNWRCRF